MALSRKFQNRIMPSCRALFMSQFFSTPCRIILGSTVSDKLNGLSVFKCNLILRYDMWPLNFVYFHFCFEDMRGRFFFFLNIKAGIQIFEVFPWNIGKHGQCFDIANNSFFVVFSAVNGFKKDMAGWDCWRQVSVFLHL